MKITKDRSMESYDIWNEINIILQTFDSPEICDDDLKIQLEQFKLKYENARKVKCVMYDDNYKNMVSRGATVKNKFVLIYLPNIRL